jgi:hypothetical protein
MVRNSWQRLFSSWETNLYTDFLVLACLAIALIIGIIHWQRSKIYYLFIAYIIAAIVLLTCCDIIRFFLPLDSKESAIFIETCNVAFAVIEMSIYTLLFGKILRSSPIRKIMSIILLCFCVIVFVFFLKEFDGTLNQLQVSLYSNMIISIELIYLCIICIVYYYEMVKQSPTSDILATPSFWITSGLFFYCLVISSFLIISTSLKPNYKAIHIIFFAVHYVSFGALFLAISKAFLCRKPLTT